MRYYDRMKNKAYRLLKRSEKFFKTDMIYLAKGGFWLSFGKGVGIVASLILSVAFANLLPPDVYGNYRFVLSIAGIVGAFTLSGMGTAIVQAVARGYEGALRTGFVTHLKWSVGIAIASFAAATYYFINDNLTLATSLLIVGTLSPFLESFKLYGSFLTGKKEFRTATLYGMFRKFVPLVALVTTLFLIDNVVIIVLVYFASHTLTAAIFYTITLKKFAPHAEVDQSTISYSKHLSAMNVIGRVAANIDKILIFHYLGAAQLAVYSFALSPPKQLQNLNGIISTLATPKLSARSIEELKTTLSRKVGFLFLVIAVMVGIYIIFAPFLYQLLFPQYLESVIFSQVFALTLLFVPDMFFRQTFIAHMKKQQLYTLKITTPVMKIILLAVLLPFYGIWGAIAAILSTRILNSIATFYLFMKL